MSRRPLALALALALPSAANATDLMQTYELARAGDTTLSIAESTRLIDKEGAVQARAALLPQITGSVGYDLEHNSRPGDPLGDGKSRSYGAKVSQTIFDWSRIANLRGQKALSQAADYDLASANNDLITRTSAAYFNVLIGIESLAAAETNEAASKKQFDYAQKRLDVGLAPITDVHEARAQYDSARANTILARNALDDSYRALAELTGQPISGLSISASGPAGMTGRSEQPVDLPAGGSTSIPVLLGFPRQFSASDARVLLTGKYRAGDEDETVQWLARMPVAAADLVEAVRDGRRDLLADNIESSRRVRRQFMSELRRNGLQGFRIEDANRFGERPQGRTAHAKLLADFVQFGRLLQSSQAVDQRTEEPQQQQATIPVHRQLAIEGPITLATNVV